MVFYDWMLGEIHVAKILHPLKIILDRLFNLWIRVWFGHHILLIFS